MNFSKVFLTLTALVAGTGAILATTTSAMANPPAGVNLAKEQVLNYHFADIGSLDPTYLQHTDDFSIARILFQTLLVQAPNGDFVPGTAESYDVSNDGLVWTFHIRPDAKWSDGKPVRAQDFEYSWRRLADPKTAAPYSLYLSAMNIVNAKKVAEGKLPVTDLGVKAIDDHTFQVTLSRPTPWLDTMLPLSVLAPERKDIIEKFGPNWTHEENLVNNGPFNLTTYRINDTIKFVKSNTFWNAKNNAITNINVDFVNDVNANYYGFISGKYLVSTIPSQFKNIVDKKYKDDIVDSKSLGVYWLEVNAKVVPDVRARKALALLVNRKLLTKIIYKSNIPTSAIVPENISGAKYVKQQSWFTDLSYAQRRAEAVKLLEEAGYTPEHPLKLKYLTAAPKNNKFFIALQNWYQVGSGHRIKLEIEPAEGKIYYSRLAAKKYEITFTGWVADYPQITTFLDVFRCNSGVNSSYFCNPKYDALLDEATHTLDVDKRNHLYAQAEQMVVDNYDYIPVWRLSGTFLKSPRLQGYNPDNQFRYFNDYYILAK